LHNVPFNTRGLTHVVHSALDGPLHAAHEGSHEDPYMSIEFVDVPARMYILSSLIANAVAGASSVIVLIVTGTWFGRVSKTPNIFISLPTAKTNLLFCMLERTFLLAKLEGRVSVHMWV